MTERRLTRPKRRGARPRRSSRGRTLLWPLSPRRPRTVRRGCTPVGGGGYGPRSSERAVGAAVARGEVRGVQRGASPKPEVRNQYHAPEFPSGERGVSRIPGARRETLPPPHAGTPDAVSVFLPPGRGA